LSDPQVEQLETYLQLLKRWNQAINLTALDTTHFPESALDRLIGEPLRAIELLARFPASALGRQRQWFDVGSGSGSPAIPMKVAEPSMELTMVESRGRKASFLREAVRQMELSGANVDPRRVEDVADGSRVGELVSMRGVRLAATIVHAAKALLPAGGYLLAIGSDDVARLEGDFLLVAEAGPIQLFERTVSRGTL
jgi:16S rRNA (guanine527-N7)-methyltransferase